MTSDSPPEKTVESPSVAQSPSSAENKSEPSEETQELSAVSVKARAVAGLKAMAARTFASQVLRVVSALSLAHLLFPKDYGLFGAAASITGMSQILGDVGLSAALVRSHRKPTEDELVTVFWCQQIITSLIAGILIFSTPYLIQAYRLTAHAGMASFLLIAMSLKLYLTSFRIIPMMSLERELQFKSIARAELYENLAQTGSTILLAFLHIGPAALAGGLWIGGIVGLVSIWWASPWRPRGRFRLHLLKELTGFGLAFQLNGLVPGVVTGWGQLVGSRLLGVTNLGYANWGINIASAPQQLVGILNRIAFPAYSRLQNDPEARGAYLKASIRRIGAVLWLAVPLFVLVFPGIIGPLFSHKWDPAIPIVQWFSLEFVLATFVGLLASSQNADGRAAERLWVTIAVGILRCTVSYFAVLKFGLAGVGPTNFGISVVELAVSAILVERASKACHGIVRETFIPFISTLFCLAASLAVGQYAAILSGGSLLIRIVTSLGVFALTMGAREALTGGKLLWGELLALRRMLRPSKATGQN